jgi:hypothetical protein
MYLEDLPDTFPWHLWPHETTEDEPPAETPRRGAMRKTSLRRCRRTPKRACHRHPPTDSRDGPKPAMPAMTRERQRRDIRQPGATPRANGATHASPGQRPGAPRQGLCLHMKRRAGFPTRRRGLFMPNCPADDVHARPPSVPGMQVLRIPERRALASAEMRSIHTANAPQCRARFTALGQASSACGLAFQLEPLRGQARTTCRPPVQNPGGQPPTRGGDAFCHMFGCDTVALSQLAVQERTYQLTAFVTGGK